MKTQNLSTLKIHKLTQAQYDRELAAGRIDENALYLTPDESIDTYSKSEIDNKLENISFEVDSSLSTTSTNPVENKAITN